MKISESFVVSRRQLQVLDSNGVPNSHKFDPPTPPTEPVDGLNGANVPDVFPESDTDDVLVLPDSNGMVKSLDVAVFAVPPVPKARKTYGRKEKSANSDADRNATDISEPFVGDDSPTSSDLPSHRRLINGSLKESREDTVAKMLVAIASILRRGTEDRLTNMRQRFLRLNSYHVNHAVENTLKGATSSFHDFLNRESYRTDAKIATSSLALPPPLLGDETSLKSPKTAKEDPTFQSTSTKTNENSSTSDLFGVHTVSKDDMKNKTSSQLMEFVKRVESNQRREAFHMQQRPTYLLKLARNQSVDRAATYITTSQSLQRAVDRFYSDDPHVTDSSSGGESADELEDEAFQSKIDIERLFPIEQRALFRYASARNAIAARYLHAHRQLARLEYGSQVVTNLLQRLQQKQGVATFGGNMDDVKPTLKSYAPLHKDRAIPRSWDEREITSVSKSPCSTTFLRFPTAKTTSASSLHPLSTANYKRKFKVAAPNNGLNSPFENYEATMWKDRLSAGKLIADNSDSEEVEETLDDDVKDVRELTEAVVSSARGCARARPLVFFQRRISIPLPGYPPKRLQQDDKNRKCDCYDRSLMPDTIGPISCTICMGQLPLPVWNSRTALLRSPHTDAVAMIDSCYHPRLSQPSNRALDAELAGVSIDLDPCSLLNSMEPIKARQSSRIKSVSAIEAEAELLQALRSQERVLKAERAHLLAMEPHRRDERLYAKGKPRSKTHHPSRGKGKSKIVRPKASGSRKRRHSSVSSDTTVSSQLSNLSRSTSLNSSENTKAVLKRVTNRTNSTISKSGRKKENVGDSGFVIPYGMSAPSKIEKIQYKEIIVPKFRDLKLLNGHQEDVGGSAESFIFDLTDPEELSDEDLEDSVFARRHDVCEIEERARFNVPEKNVRKRNPNPVKNQRRNSEMPANEGESSVEMFLNDQTEDQANLTSGMIQPVAIVEPKRSNHKNKSSSRNRNKRDTNVIITNDQLKIKASKRPRKTPEELAALCASRTPRPVRTRRSTMRSSPDDKIES